jgi:hypothetical protein
VSSELAARVVEKIDLLTAADIALLEVLRNEVSFRLSCLAAGSNAVGG